MRSSHRVYLWDNPGGTGLEVYQSTWLSISNGGWIELGTGYVGSSAGGCNNQPNCRYHYMYFQQNSNVGGFVQKTFFPATGSHVYKIFREAGTNLWDATIDGVVFNKVFEDWSTGWEVTAGLESWNSAAVFPKGDYYTLQYERNDGAWTYFSGRDLVWGPNAPVCGGWNDSIDYSWYAGESTC